MSLRRMRVPALAVAVAAALMGAAAVAQYRPLLGMPLVIAIGLGALWLLAARGAEL